jgi:hypothetical protein
VADVTRKTQSHQDIVRIPFTKAMPILKCRPIFGLPIVKGKIITRVTKITADCTNEDIATKPAIERVDFIETGLILCKALCAEKYRNVNGPLIN